MKLKRFLCLLLAVFMVVGVFASCGDEEPEADNKPPQTNTGGNNNGGSGGSGSGSGGSGSGSGGGENAPETEKYPWLNRIYRFSEEKFTVAPNEQEGIVNYLKSIGAIAADEADEEKIAKVLDMLAYAERREVQFLTGNAVKVVSEDRTYEADYLYKIDVYKNIALYALDDTAMKNKLPSPVYTLSLDGKSLTLKVPFSYVTVDGEGNSSTVNCKSFSTLTFTRDETLKTDAVPEVEGKSYELANYALRFADDAAREAFELDQGMTADAWLALKNATITESNSGVLRIEPKGKLVLEKVVGSGITIGDASYYITVAAGGVVTLYNTEEGRDNEDEADLVTDVTVFFAVDGKRAVVAEGTDTQILRVYAFDKDVAPEVIPSVSGKAYKLSEYTFRFASDGDRVSLESEKGKTLDAILAELNATITENRYKTLTVTDDGKIVCETVTESGSVISEFTYFAVMGEDGVMTLYKTLAGRENADANELVTALTVTVTAQGVEIATPIFAGSESVQIEVYAFEKDFEEESVSDPKGNAYKLSKYGFQFASEDDIAVLESMKGKTVAQIIAELNATVTETDYRMLTVSKNGKVECIAVTTGGVTAAVFTYYGTIGEDGKVTLYKTAAGRDAENADDLVTDIAITVTSKGIAVATALFEAPASVQTELYVFDKALEEITTDIKGNSYLLDGYNYRFESAEALSAFETEKGKTVAQILSDEKAALASGNGKRLTIDKNGYVILYRILASNVSVGLLRGYADIADDGIVTLYVSAQGRDGKDPSVLVDTDVVILMTANGIEISYPIAGGSHVEIYKFEKELPVYNGIPTVAGSSFESNGGELRYYSQSEKDYFDGISFTQSMILSATAAKRTVYLDTLGRIYSIKASGSLEVLEWLYYFDVNDDGRVVRYKTEDGRDNRDQSDVVKDNMYFSVSPDGTELEWRADVMDGCATQAVIHFSFKENVQEGAPELTDKVYLSSKETPLIWIFDGNGVLTAFQNNEILYTYYAKVIAGKVFFYTDPDARDLGDSNYLVSSLGADMLLNGSILRLSDGTTLYYNDTYTKAKSPALSFSSDTQTEYIEVYNLSIDLSGNVTTNSDGAKIFQWFEGRGMYKSPITSAPKTEGEYTLRVTTAPTANYKTASAEIVITVITYEEFTEDCIKVTLQNTVTLRKGQKYIADVVISAGQHLMFLDGASDNTKIYRFNFRADEPDYIGLDELILEEDVKWMGEVHDYVCSSDGRPVVFYTEDYIGETYRVVWTASEDCTIEVGTYRIY